MKSKSALEGIEGARHPHRAWHLLVAVTMVFGLNTAHAALKVKEPVAVTLNVGNGQFIPGSQIQAEIRFQIAAPWHIYGKDPGEAGLPTQLAWKLPEGFTISKPVWPAAKKFNDQGIQTHGYETELVLIFQITAPETAELYKSTDIELKLSWLACDGKLCIPGKTTIQTQLVAVSRTRT